MKQGALRRAAGVAGLVLAGGGATALALGAGPVAWAAVGAGALLAQGLFFDLSPTKIPVVMLHSIAADRPGRPETFDIWCPPWCFEGYLRYLKWRGFETITLAHLHEHLQGRRTVPKKPIVLTFDDGYLDNWVYAAPLLRKYGFTGTVFMPSDFIQPGATPRPTIEDVWKGKIEERELEVFGYLNEAELRALAQEGTLDIQSHGRTHTWLPISERVVDFHNPTTRMRQLRWMWWNRHPEEKPFWFERIDHEGVPWGAPVYENKLALSSPAVTPDPALERLLVMHVQQEGGRAFFERGDWRTQLESIVAAHRAQRPCAAVPESREVFRARLREELLGARERIEEVTGREVRFMCWPNGGTCPDAFELLQECGYHAATLPSRMKQPQNFQGSRPDRIGRISATAFFRGAQRTIPWTISFALKVERNRGVLYADVPIKGIWLWRRIFPAPGASPHGAEERA